ncbi:MAG: glutamate--tRNA ligase [Pseudomonadota bacterium]
MIVTRFAPSPTGFLHIGGARTALFCWLYARRHNGKFLLRIEDTDRERSTEAATQAIIDGMKWLGLNHDGEIVYQFANIERHKKVAEQLLKEGKAYHCYTSSEELVALRAEGKSYDRTWRDRDNKDAPIGVKPVVRLKSPLQGEVIITDHVRGEIRVAANQLEDLVILRSDGTPTYNLAVVVDDHDMGVTHIIRGEDHITNAAKQIVIYQHLGWEVPHFAHIPLIHGADGAKLSKRHGALGVEAYQEMGYLPEALRNYLLRLGWAHGDAEIISETQAIEWFNLEGIGKSPSRFDFTKLENLNGHYIREADNKRLAQLILPIINNKILNLDENKALPILIKAMNGLKQRAKTINELAENAAFYMMPRPIQMNEKAEAILNSDAINILADLSVLFENTLDWSEENLQNTAKKHVEEKSNKLGNIAQPIRAALTGSNISPSVFEAMFVLGKEESLARIKDVL